MDISSKLLSIIKYSLIIAGVYDLILATAIFVMYRILFELFNERIPQPLLIFQTIGLFLIFTGILLLFASKSPLEFYFIGLSSAVIRFIYFLLVVVFYSSHIIYLITSITDLLTGLGILIPYILYFIKTRN